jgi:hypothetical protein
MKTRFTNLHARPAVLVPSIIENMLHDHNWAPSPVKRVPGSTPAIYLAGIRQVFGITLFHNDLFFNIYTIGLGTSFYNLLVPLHTNILYNTNQISQTSNIQLISIIFNKLRIIMS